VVLLTSWRFWAVVLGFVGCIWISLFVLNSDVLLVGLFVVFVVGAIFLRITGTSPGGVEHGGMAVSTPGTGNRPRVLDAR
jgi:hypothetical protein